MAVTTVTVDGKVLDPSGTSYAGGTLTLELSEDGTTPDGATNRAVGGSFNASIGSDGSVSFSVIPNDVITPSNTYYRVTIKPTGYSAWIEAWEVASSPDPVNIGAVPRR